MNKKAGIVNLTLTKGNTLIELIIVMTMIALLGGVLVSLVSTGGNSFQKVSDNFKLENEARIAMSYITVKIRQNDTAGGIDVLSIPERLRIKKPSEPGYWEIYGRTESGRKQLVEDDGNPVTPPAVIAEDIEFDVSMSADLRQIYVTITYMGTRELKETITLRSE